MKRLLIVSNRLPITVEKRKGNLLFRQSTGGLATGLRSFYRSYDSIWIGWSGITLDKISTEEKKSIETKLMSEFNCYPIFLSQNNIEKHYHGFCNKTIWPLFHSFTQYAVYEKGLWESYRQANKLFFDAIIEKSEPDDIIWIHDYHLMLLPKLLREKLSNASIGFFLHIPFPTFEIFRLLPWRKEILEGLLGADVIGFHTYDYARHFLSSVQRLLGYEYSWGQITAYDRIINTDVFPMGIDYQLFSKAAQDPGVQKEVTKFRKKLSDRKIILSIDRLDYTKGIPQRLEVFDNFLKKNPEYKEKVSLILVAVPSRTQVEHYKLLKKQVDELIGKINGEHGTIGWVPVLYLYRSLPFSSLAALYSIADIAIVTPLRDGMNLIAKEYIATKADGKGVLILSEMAGASNELGEAIIVNPNNSNEMLEALEKALMMPEKKQIEHNKPMQERLKRYSVVRWAEEFIDRLLYTKKLQSEMYTKMLTYEVRWKLVSDYRKSKRRLLLFDYDGTLVPFFGKPEEAKPSNEILKLLKKLAEDQKNEVVLISGRDKDTLESWFGNLNLSLVAEHGVWLKESVRPPGGKEWELIEPLTSDWKEKIRPILELHVDRTPGSFIEEKNFSLAWHYRKADLGLSLMRARELMDNLINLTANLNLEVLEGNKVIEVKNAGINKSRVTLRWISKKSWDFILAVGDDWTDEDIFAVLPDEAYSLKVGLTPTKAKFNLNSVMDVRLLLKDLGR